MEKDKSNLKEGRRRSSGSSQDRERKDSRLGLSVANKKFMNQALVSKLLTQAKGKSSTEESAASALAKVMTRKKGLESLALQIEIDTETQWKFLMRKDGLIVVEVYAGWAGPCLSMTSFLKKVKAEINDDRLTLALANSDILLDLKAFKGQTEPTWIFIGGGKPVKLMRGPNAGKLVKAIKAEFEYELLCMEGKAKRNLISVNNEAERKQVAVSTAVALCVEDASAAAATITAEHAVVQKVPSEEKSAEGGSMDEEELENKIKMDAEEAAVMVDFTRDANAKLLAALQPFTIIGIQNFLLETGAVTELKDYIKDDFQLVQERYTYLQEDGIRKIFGIPYEIPTLVEDEEVAEGVSTAEGGEVNPKGDADDDSNGPDSTYINKPSEDEERPTSPIANVVEEPQNDGETSIMNATEETGSEAEGDISVEVIAKEPRVVMVPVTLPEELVGDTLFFLLESIEIRKSLDESPENAILQSADEIMTRRMGPEQFQEAVENEPKSLHALYGREEHACGVWCPRNYEDKRYVMLNFFPRFVTEMLEPPPKDCPKYILAIFPTLFANEIMDNLELLNCRKDVLARGMVFIPFKLAERMLKSKGLAGDDLEAQIKAFTGFEMFAVSIDARNVSLAEALNSLEPIHLSVDVENGKVETARLFPHLNVLIDDDDEERALYRDFIAEKFLSSRSKQRLEAILDSESNSNVDEPSTPKTNDDNSFASQENLQTIH